MCVWADVYFCDVADQQLTDVQAKENVYHLQHLTSNMLSNILTSTFCVQRENILF